MRRNLFAAAGLLAFLTFAPVAAFAEANVLLPSDTSNAGAANLGLSVAPQQAAQSSATMSGAPPPPAASESMAAMPAMPETGAAQQKQTPAPARATISLSDLVTSPDTAEQKAHLPQGTMATTVIHQPDDAAMLAQVGANLPYSLAITLVGQSIFGSQDIQKIMTKLGLSRDQIAQSCTLGASGIVQTSKGASLFNSNGSPQGTVRYDGMIKNYILGAEAYCQAATLPPGSGMLTEIGNRYKIPLQPIKCAAPNHQVTNLNITYDGTGTSECSYE